jgi:hypothetical protein
MLNGGTACAASSLHLSFDEYFSVCLQYFLVDRAPLAKAAANTPQ